MDLLFMTVLIRQNNCNLKAVVIELCMLNPLCIRFISSPELLSSQDERIVYPCSVEVLGQILLHRLFNGKSGNIGYSRKFCSL